MKKTWQIGIAAAAAGGAGWTMVYFFFNQGLYQPFLWQGTAVLFFGLMVWTGCLIAAFHSQFRNVSTGKKAFIGLLILLDGIIGGAALFPILFVILFHMGQCYHQMLDRLLTWGGIVLESIF